MNTAGQTSESQRTRPGLHLRSAECLHHATCAAGEVAVLRVAFEAPAASYASVYYMEQETQGYRHQRREKLPAEQGFNELYFLLSSPTMTGPLLVRPGSVTGDYPIIDCELRVIRR